MLAETPVDVLASAIQDTLKAWGTLVTLEIPKFSISSGSEDFVELLKEMGLSKLFIKGECDFGDMFKEVSADPTFEDGCL